MSNKKKLKQLKSSSNYFHRKWPFLVALFFPVALCLIYNFIPKKILILEPGEVLTYYGVVFGLFASYCKYTEDKRKAELKRQRELTPSFSIEIVRNSTHNKAFDVRVELLNDLILRDIYLYDEALCDYMVKGRVMKKTIAFCEINERDCQTDNSINISIIDDESILDEDEYPKYVQIICDDTDNNSWVCDFIKVTTNNEKLYRPMSPWIA